MLGENPSGSDGQLTFHCVVNKFMIITKSKTCYEHSCFTTRVNTQHKSNISKQVEQATQSQTGLCLEVQLQVLKEEYFLMTNRETDIILGSFHNCLWIAHFFLICLDSGFRINR